MTKTNLDLLTTLSLDDNVSPEFLKGVWTGLVIGKVLIEDQDQLISEQEAASRLGLKGNSTRRKQEFLRLFVIKNLINPVIYEEFGPRLYLLGEVEQLKIINKHEYVGSN